MPRTCQRICETPCNTSGNSQSKGRRAQEANSLITARGGPDKPGSETAAPGGVQHILERPEGDRSHCVDKTNPPNPDTRPGGHMGTQGESRDLEGNQDSKKAVGGAKLNGIHPRSDRSEYVETNAVSRYQARRPFGQTR